MNMETGRSDGYEKSKPLKDKWNLVYLTAFYVGISSLFPWNILISVPGYWDYKLRNVTANSTDDANHLTDLQKIYYSYLAIASHIPNSLSLIITACFGQKFSMKLQIFGSQVKTDSEYERCRFKWCYLILPDCDITGTVCHWNPGNRGQRRMAGKVLEHQSRSYFNSHNL